MAKLKYPWDSLSDQGDWVVVPDVAPTQVRASLSWYLKQYFPENTIAVTREIDEGTFVALAQVPPEPSEVEKKVFFSSEQIAQHLPPTDDPDEEIRQYLDD